MPKLSQTGWPNTTPNCVYYPPLPKHLVKPKRSTARAEALEEHAKCTHEKGHQHTSTYDFGFSEKSRSQSMR